MNHLLRRIKELAENEGLSLTNLEIKIGASKGVISRAFTKGTDIQSKWVSAIVENYPLYNAAWLLTGKGEMKSSDTNSTATNGDELRRLEKEIIELQREIIKLQKENMKLRDFKSTKHTHVRETQS